MARYRIRRMKGEWNHIYQVRGLDYVHGGIYGLKNAIKALRIKIQQNKEKK